MSISSSSSACHSAARPHNVVRPVSLLESNTIHPMEIQDGWQLPWENSHTFADELNFGNDSTSREELELRQMPNTWPSQPEIPESQRVEQILKRLSYNESNILSRTISSEGITICDSVSSDNLGVTPLNTAAKRGHVNIVRLLLEHDAGCNVQDGEGLTPLMQATVGGFEEVAGLLLSHDAGVQFADHRGQSALHWAVIHRRDRLLKILLKHCVENKSVVDGLTREGKTPLHIAVDTDFEAAVEMLLSSGADAQQKAYQKH